MWIKSHSKIYKDVKKEKYGAYGQILITILNGMMI